MKQGTISIICGCHSFMHSIQVTRAWIKIYGKLPNLKELICIFLHDIGHLGLNYLDDFEQKKIHWKLGAKIAGKLFGEEYYNLVAGHCRYSGIPDSRLKKPDKLSWHLAPRWWMFLNTFFEPKLRTGYERWEAVDLFKAQVADNVKNNFYKSNHQMYLDRCK